MTSNQVTQEWEGLSLIATRGSSGYWTASIAHLPISVGGCKSSQEAIDALQIAHWDRMSDSVYSALVARALGQANSGR